MAKVKKTPEELKKERDAKVASTAQSLRLQILTLEKKRDTLLPKVMEARTKGLKEQEAQARGLVKQTMAAIKRANGMLMTLELAIESRDLAELNVNFLESIGSLSDDILGSGKTMSKSRIKRIGDKFLVSQYAADKQRKQMDEMLAIGDYASLVSSDSGQYSEFDDEIDSMLESTPAMSVDPLGSKYKSRF